MLEHRKLYSQSYIVEILKKQTANPDPVGHFFNQLIRNTNKTSIL